MIINTAPQNEAVLSNVGEIGEFQQALHRSVFTEGSVQHGEHHVERVRAGLGDNRPGFPAPLLGDEDSGHVVLRRIQPFQDRLTGTQ